MDTTAKTITTRAGETFTLDFYCEPRAAYMTFIGCDRMRAAAKKAKNAPPKKWDFGPIDENPCLSCSQGSYIAARNHSRRQPGRNRGDQPRGVCMWPGCTHTTHASGLCQAHSRALKRNALIKINTSDAGALAVQEFMLKLIEMAADAAMPIEDVALAAMDEGVKIYFERKKRRQ